MSFTVFIAISKRRNEMKNVTLVILLWAWGGGRVWRLQLWRGNHPSKEGHDWNDGEVTKAANCTEKGVKTFKCKNCDETKTEEIAIDATNHKRTRSSNRPCEPGCETAGSKDGKSVPLAERRR